LNDKMVICEGGKRFWNEWDLVGDLGAWDDTAWGMDSQWGDIYG
jgi:hypothetical protein